MASKETDLEVNAGRIKFMVMSRDQNAGQIHSVKADNSSFEMVEVFKYLGTTLTNEIRECLQSFGAESFAFQKFKD